MSDQTIEIECLNCEKDFETSNFKREGDTFRCTHCDHNHETDVDVNEDGEFEWFAISANNQ